MSHPGECSARERGGRMLKESGYRQHRASGGAVHEDEAEDKQLIAKELRGARIEPKRRSGGKVPGKEAMERPDRRARGGATKHHAGPKAINIIIGKDDDQEGKQQAARQGLQAGVQIGAKQAAAKLAGGMPPGGPPGAPPGGPPMPPPGPMAGPPPGPMPGMPPRNMGGMIRRGMDGRFAGGAV